jgi:hypothetical protein
MRTLLLLVGVAVASASLLAVPASATPPSTSTGTFAVVTATTTDVRTAGGNTFVTVARTALISGTFNGTAVDTIKLVMHANGTTSVHGDGTCACSIGARAGTFDYSFRGSGTFPDVLSGTYVVGHGTAGLEGLHAEGPFAGTFFVASLGGQHHFDP